MSHRRCLALASLLALAPLAVTPARSGAQGLQAVCSKDGTDVWAAGDAGALWRSLDGGVSYARSALGARTLRAVAHRGFVVLAAGDSAAIWRSDDDGGTFAPVAIPAAAIVRSLAFGSDGRVFACGDAGLLLRSDDGGASWYSQAGGGTQRLNALAFTDADHGWAAGAAGTLLRTTNGGVNWSPVPLATARELFAVAQNGATVWVVGAAATAFASGDGGSSFAPVALGTDAAPDVRAVACPAPGEAWLAGGGGFLRGTSDGGASWTFAQHPVHGALSALAFAAGQGFAVSSRVRAALHGTGAGAWTLPAGVTPVCSWQQVLAKTSGASLRGNTFAIHPLDPHVLYAVLGSSLVRSPDDGETWRLVRTMPNTKQANVFLISPRDTAVMLMASVTPLGARQVVRSTDGGANWQVALTHAFGEYGIPIERDPDRPDTLFFGGDSDTLYRSLDGGVTWRHFGLQSFRSPCDLVVRPGNDSVIVVGDGVTSLGNAELWLSTDGGHSFSMRQVVAGSEVPAISTSRLRPDRLFAANWTMVGARTSFDAGATWPLAADMNRTGQQVADTWGNDIAHDDPNVFMVGVFSGSTSYLSLDGGGTFAPIPLTGSNEAVVASDRATILAMQSGGLYKLRAAYPDPPAPSPATVTLNSPNGGETWAAGETQPITWTANHVALARLEWRAGPAEPWQPVADVEGSAGSYPWRVPAVATAAAEVRIRDAWGGPLADACDAPFAISTGTLAVDLPAPAAFALGAVAPNPRAAAAPASVRFEVPRRARVRLELYDVQGKRVATLADAAFGPGRFTLPLTGADRAGVYFLRMLAPGFAASRRVFVLR